MSCPFFKMSTVRSCDLSPGGRIVGGECSPHGEICSTPDFRRCALLSGRAGLAGGATACPFLRVATVQYCSAAPVMRYIPYNQALTSLCLGPGYRHCDLYLSRAHPERLDGERHRGDPGRSRDPGGNGNNPGLDAPEDFEYSRNHWWLEVHPDGTFHLGVDAFLAAAFDALDEIYYLPVSSVRRPAVVFRVQSTDLTLTFPNTIHVTSGNTAVRSDPRLLLRDPYGAGWLFSGREPVDALGRTRPGIRTGLISGERASCWMRSECDRLTRYVHEHLVPHEEQGTVLMADGGTVRPGFASGLDRADLIAFFDEFFRNQTTGRLP